MLIKCLDHENVILCTHRVPCAFEKTEELHGEWNDHTHYMKKQVIKVQSNFLVCCVWKERAFLLYNTSLLDHYLTHCLPGETNLAFPDSAHLGDSCLESCVLWPSWLLVLQITSNELQISACAKLLRSFSGMVYALDRKDNTLGIISLAKSLYSNATSCTTVLPAFFSTV